MAFSKVQRGKMEEAEKLEGQSCGSNLQNSDEHIVPTQIMKSVIKYPKPSQSTGVFPKVCLFCNQARKRIKGKKQELSSAESKNSEQNIRKYIEWQDDQMLSVCLNNVVSSENEIKYHGICRLKNQAA